MSEIDSDIDDICSDVYEPTESISDASEPDENTFDEMLQYINSVALQQIKPLNKTKREIQSIKAGISTKKKLDDKKRDIKKIFSEKKKYNNIYETNRIRLQFLYAQKNTDINSVKINRKEFFKVCPDNLKAKIFITTSENFAKSNIILQKLIKNEYLLDEIERHLYDFDNEVNIFEELDEDITISEISDVMRKHAPGPDYMKYIMYVNTFEFNRFITYAKNTIQIKGSIKDIEALIDELPEFLSNSEKENKLREMFAEAKEFGMDHIAKFLMYKQTSGLYYQALIFLADYYKVEHRNCVPLFENLNTGDIKEEALGIYITLRAYQTDEFIVDNYNFMTYTLQEPQQISWLSYRSSKKTDMTLPNIRTNHEFNENHHAGKKYKLNDAKKRSYAKIRGRHTIYFYFDTKQPNTRKNIKSYLCDEYMTQYVKECRENAINAIVLNGDARDRYIFKLLKESLVKQVANINETLDKYKNTEFAEACNEKLETRNFKQSILNDLNNSQIAIDMFACKALGSISFQKLCNLFDLLDKTRDQVKITELKLCLSKLDIVEHPYIDEKYIKLTWKQLNQTIIKFDTKKKMLGNILYEYWLELNESYENIILRIQTFYENLVCNETDRIQIEDLIREQLGKFV